MKTINKTKNHSANKHQKTWYKLDLSANVYPTLQRKNFSNVFRLSVVLKEEIDPDTLQKAVDLTLPRFPAFKVALRKGIFWRYLEPNDRTHPAFGEALRRAEKAGVQVLAVDCQVTPESIRADQMVEVRL